MTDLEKEWAAAKPISLETEWDRAEPIPAVPVAKTTPAEQEPSMEWKDVFKSAITNIPSSAYQFGAGIYQTIRHPIQTGKAIGKTAIGGIEKLIPGTQEYEQYADAFAKAMIERYGSVENFKQTLAQDPVGFAADVATVLIPAGKVVTSAGQATRVGIVARAGAAIEKVGASIEPVNVAKQVVALPLKAIPQAATIKMYKSAAKFSSRLTTKQRTALTKTALEHEIMPTIKGLVKLQNKIVAIRDEVDRMIDMATTTGQKMPVDQLFKYFDELMADAALSGKPQTAQRQIMRVKKEILEINEAAGRTELTARQAQKLKTTIYRELETYYSKTRNSPWIVKAQKSVARASKEFLEEVMPEIKQMNASEGAMIELREAIEKSAARINNRDILGIGTPLKVMTGQYIGHLPGAATGLVLSVLETPRVKAKLAIVANRLNTKGVKIKPNAALMRLLASEAGRLDTVEKIRETK